MQSLARFGQVSSSVGFHSSGLLKICLGTCFGMTRECGAQATSQLTEKVTTAANVPHLHPSPSIPAPKWDKKLSRSEPQNNLVNFAVHSCTFYVGASVRRCVGAGWSSLPKCFEFISYLLGVAISEPNVGLCPGTLTHFIALSWRHRRKGVPLAVPHQGREPADHRNMAKGQGWFKCQEFGDTGPKCILV